MKSADSLTMEAHKLVKNYDQTFWELGLVLKDLTSNYPEEFVEILKGLGFGKRKAYYLIDIVSVFEPLIGPANIEVRRLRNIGWTKLKDLLDHVNPSNLETLLEWAEEHTVENLSRVLAGLEPIYNQYKLTFLLNPNEFKLLSNVLSKFGAKTKGKHIANKEAALMAVLKSLKAD